MAWGKKKTKSKTGGGSTRRGAPAKKAAPKLETRKNESGYTEYKDPKTGKWRSTHRRVAEKKLGALRAGFHVHHVDGDKTNNRSTNLVEAHPKVHGRLHQDPGVCLRCGRKGHWARSCCAKTFYDGRPIID